MPFNRPTLPALIARAESDINTRLPGADARVRRSNLNALARVNSGGAHGLHGHIDWASKQILPDKAEKEFLERHAKIWLREGRLPAVPAVGYASVTGTSGAIVPEGSIYRRVDGVRYITTADATLVGGAATIHLEAVESGQSGNAAAGIVLNAETPIANVNAVVTVTVDALTGGTEMEGDDALLARILDRIQNPPMGGSKADYEKWAKQVPGVTRAWCYPQEMGDGTVTVRFVRDDDASPIPDAAEVVAVQEYIEEVRPVTGHLFVVAPIASPMNFQIQLTPATAAAKAAVEASLKDLIRREALPEGGSGEGTILLTHIREAISLAAGESDHVLSVPSANVTQTIGHMATYGGVTWA